MSVAIESFGPPLPILRPRHAREAAEGVWLGWIRGVPASTVATRVRDLVSFGASTWHVRDEITVIRRVQELAASDRGAFRDAVLVHLESEEHRGIAPATLARRWATLAGLARAISRASPRAPAVTLGPRPRGEWARAGGPIVARLLERGEWRDAVIVGLVATTALRREEIAELRMGELAARSGTADLRRAIAEHTRGHPRNACAFDGRMRGRPCSRSTIDRVCERHGTSVAALRGGRGHE